MNPDPFVRALLVVATGVLVVILALMVWSTVNASSITSVNDRLDKVERSLNYNSCLLLILPEDRLVRGVTDCQSDE